MCQFMQCFGDLVILNFDELLDVIIVSFGIILFEDGLKLENVDVKVDGIVVVLNLKGGFKYVSEYIIQINGLIDIVGNVVLN